MNATTQPATAIVMAEKFVDWAISSQAGQEWAEGSTTSGFSPDRMKPPRVRGSMAYKRVTGVYAIRHVETDSTYIGSAVCTSSRIAMHKRELRRGIHSNKVLQRIYAKYGDVLQYSIVEVCDRSVLRQREQVHIDNVTGRLINLEMKVCELAPPEAHSQRMLGAWAHRDVEKRAEIGRKVSDTLKKRYAMDHDLREQNAARLAAARASEAFKVKHQSEQANAKRSEATRQYWKDNAAQRSESIKAGMRRLPDVTTVCGQCGMTFVGKATRKWCSSRCRVAACVTKSKAKAC